MVNPGKSKEQAMIKSYRIGHTYRDCGGVTKEGDQFLGWINIPGSGMLNSPGIRPLWFVNKVSELPAYLILVTHEKTRGTLNPWEDVVDHTSGQILYWGDAKYHSSKRHDEFAGNKVLRLIQHYLLDGKKDFVPPILHFSKQNKGEVTFNGLCVLDKLELSWFDDHGKPVRNYRAQLTILDEEEISVSWLHCRARAKNLKDFAAEAPPAWKNYLKGNIKKLDLWKSTIRSTENQLPPDKSQESEILAQIFAVSPTHFEAIVVALFKQMTSICHSISRTRPTADGGFDFYGTFLLPRPLDYRINFVGEAKKYARSTPVKPKDVSRLVARLGRGEYGLFVTTSYYTKQTQQEVLEDAYPVRLISGLDLINIMKELRIISNGVLDEVWINSVLEQAVKESDGQTGR